MIFVKKTFNVNTYNVRQNIHVNLSFVLSEFTPSSEFTPFDRYYLSCHEISLLGKCKCSIKIKHVKLKLRSAYLSSQICICRTMSTSHIDSRLALLMIRNHKSITGLSLMTKCQLQNTKNLHSQLHVKFL